MKRTELIIENTWDGQAIPPIEQTTLSLALSEDALSVRIDAPFHGDPAPPEAPGPRDGLWEFEVVELFLLGTAAHYLELEFGPFGHHLALQLEGRRRVVERELSLVYHCKRQGGRWTGSARIPAAYLPEGLHACNAYAIHGVEEARRYLAVHPVPGPTPDFHRLECFAPLPW